MKHNHSQESTSSKAECFLVPFSPSIFVTTRSARHQKPLTFPSFICTPLQTKHLPIFISAIILLHLPLTDVTKYCSQVFWQNGHVQGCVHFQFQLKCFVLRCTKETFDVQKTFLVNLSRHFSPLKGSWKLTKRQIIAKLSQHTVSYNYDGNKLKHLI